MTKAGRPPFKPTRRQRLRVEELISCRMTLGDIARRIGISEPTLRQHFSDELACGWARRRAEVIELLFAAARNGNVDALIQLERMTAEVAARPRLGKKAQAEEAANSAGLGTDWGDDLQIPPTKLN